MSGAWSPLIAVVSLASNTAPFPSYTPGLTAERWLRNVRPTLDRAAQTQSLCTFLSVVLKGEAFLWSSELPEEPELDLKFRAQEKGLGMSSSETFFMSTGLARLKALSLLSATLHDSGLVHPTQQDSGHATRGLSRQKHLATPIHFKTRKACCAENAKRVNTVV